MSKNRKTKIIMVWFHWYVVLTWFFMVRFIFYITILNKFLFPHMHAINAIQACCKRFSHVPNRISLVPVLTSKHAGWECEFAQTTTSAYYHHVWRMKSSTFEQSNFALLKMLKKSILGISQYLTPENSIKFNIRMYICIIPKISFNFVGSLQRT